MLQQTSLAQALSPTQRTPRIGKSVSDATLGTGWQQVADALQLPSSIQAFLVYLIMLLLVAGAMGLHILHSVRTIEKQSQLDELTDRYVQIQRENAEILWEINQNASLDHVYAQALGLGYEPMIERKFVMGERTIVNRLEENSGLALNQP